MRIVPWVRRERLGGPYRVSSPGLLRRVLTHQAAGRVNQAYRLARYMSRHAVSRGDQRRAVAAETLIASLAPFLREGASRELDHLVQAATKAAAAEDWRTALACTEAIVDLHPDDVKTRGRALRNRATALTILGRFAEAVAAYDALMQDRQVWSHMERSYQVGFQLSRAGVAWFVEPVDVSQLGDIPGHIGRAPETWRTYWWIMGHIAWRVQPGRLEPIRRSSLRTFGLDWDPDVDRALWGLDLLAGDSSSRPGLERRVRFALEDPATHMVIGRASWLTLNFDLLLHHLSTRSADAGRLMAEHTEWLAAHGYEGWVDYLNQGRFPGLSF